MAQITITIHNREYAIACEDGQESRILQLANVLDETAKTFGDSANKISENMLLAMVGLVVADELTELKKNNGAKNHESIDGQEVGGIDEDVSKRIKIAIQDINEVANKLNLL